VAEAMSAMRDGSSPSEPSRRDFLKLLTVSSAAIGGAAIAWALIDSTNPAADVIAAGAPIDIDLSKLTPGQQIVILWRGSPILAGQSNTECLANAATAEPHRAPERSQLHLSCSSPTMR
jgi:ubiquinol-cytochrome c reductase iron-sulfur subunit